MFEGRAIQEQLPRNPQKIKMAGIDEQG